MKFAAVCRFELGYQLRRVWTWLFLTVLVAFSFIMTRDATLAEALHDDFFINSPFAIAKTTVTGCLIWILIAAAIAGEAAARDVTTKMYPLVYTTPVTKAELLLGRALAAFLLNAFLLFAVQIGIVVAVYSPGVDAALVGPFRPAAYLTAFAILALPNALFATVIQFTIAAVSGKPMASFMGSMLLFFMSYVVATFLFFQGRRELANLLDPIGIHFILSELSHLWTTAEKNWRLLRPEGVILSNRILWLAAAFLAGAITYGTFRFRHRTPVRLFRRKAPSAPHAPTPGAFPSNEIPRVQRTFGAGMQARQAIAVASASFRSLALSWAGLGLLIVIPLLSILVVIDQMESNGVPLVPTTIRVINELTSPLSAETSRWVIIPLLIVFFSGEIVWRERSAGVNELTDSMPGSEWATFAGKFLGLALLVALFMTLLMSAGIAAQLILGYQGIDLMLYVKTMLGIQLAEYLLFCVLAFAVHVVVNQKYVGHLTAVVAYVFFIALAPMIGIDHNLLLYGGGPGWSYTDMRGFEPTLLPWLFFKLYWLGWALILAVATRLLWVRGIESRFAARVGIARQRVGLMTKLITAVGGCIVVVTGSHIYYNTNVLNTYETRDEARARKAEYERVYGKYAAVPQPGLVKARLRVDIFPRQRSASIAGTYQLVNTSTAAIDTIHLATARDVTTGPLTSTRAIRMVSRDDRLGHRIYSLSHPLMPGDSLTLDFAVQVRLKGFREDGAGAAIVPNGSFLQSGDYLPSVGYRRSRELNGEAERREYGLAARPILPSLYDKRAAQDRGLPVTLDVVIGTGDGQTGVAPGALRRTWSENGRRYFHYVSDAPLGREWAFFSAQYAVHEERWTDADGTHPPVLVRFYHDPRHNGNLERMVRSVRASLDYYTAQFGPYRHSQLTIVERPGEGTGMHADPAMIIHAEGFDSWNPGDDGRGVDLPYAIVAHEMAHQWTVPYAATEGAPVMSESVAWYYGMKAVEHSRGYEHLQRLLDFMRYPYPYPPIRRGEPLLRGMDPYLSYRKGPFALYALSEYAGEDSVNTALRRMLARHRAPEAPLATTLDLYADLKRVMPDSLGPLLHDLFEVNTFWAFETNEATAAQRADGTWDVTVTFRAGKVVADSAGVEQEVPLDDWVEIALFAEGEGRHTKQPLYRRKHRLRTGEQRLSVNVATKPHRAGVDPYFILTEPEREDNVREVRWR